MMVCKYGSAINFEFADEIPLEDSVNQSGFYLNIFLFKKISSTLKTSLKLVKN